MALRFVESFDHYTTILTKWTATAGTGTVAISSGNGRRGTSSLRLTLVSTQTGYIQKTIDAQATWTVGFWVKVSSFASAPILCSFFDDATEHMRLHVTTAGLLVASRAGTTLGTSSSGLTLNTGAYVEYKVTISDAAGAYEIKVNGSSVLSGSSADTRNGGNATANIIRLGTASNTGATIDYDDFYICDGNGGAPNNTFLGDTKVQVLYPSATGTTNDWTPSTGTAANGYQLIDETAPNDDTDYLSSNTTNQVFTYNTENLSATTGTIHGVQTCILARKDDAGTRSIAPVCRSGSTDYVGSTVNLPDAYAYLCSVRETDPDTAAAWTISGVNAAEHAGAKVIA